MADSLYTHKGFSYVGQPSAFRPPLYPILLAGAHFAIGSHYLVGIRILQLLAGILTAWVCAQCAGEIWGAAAAKWCFPLVLLCPTLLFFTGEILTETFASFTAALFLLFLVRAKDGTTSQSVRLGIISGIAALLRFNLVFLPCIAAWRIVTTLKGAERRRGLIAVTCIPLAIILPWLIRNVVVFHGQVIYSTHTGMDLVEGIIEPEGRADHDQQQQIIREAGWVMQGLERDDSKRFQYPSEAVLNQQAMRAGVRLWRAARWHAGRVILDKLGYFWLSTDQLSWKSNFSFRTRLLRMSGVLFYWLLLGVAAGGMRKLLRVDKRLASTLIVYVIMATGLHLFFAMNTRLRVPLIDPLLCVLATFPFFSTKAASSSSDQTTIEAPALQT